MSQRNEDRTDIDMLRARARALFISQATIDDLLAWATPRQLQADRQAAAHGTGATARPRNAPGSCAAPGSPSPRRWTATVFTNVKLPDGYTRDELLSLDFVGRAQDLVFHAQDRTRQDPPGHRAGHERGRPGHERAVPAHG